MGVNMVTKYTVVTLDKPEVKDYIRTCLKSGRTLSKYILETIDLERGTVTTALPENGNPENLYKFKYGGIIPFPPKSECDIVTERDGSKTVWVPVHTITGYIVEVIHSHIQNGKRNICIFEDALSKPGDPGLDKSKSLMVISDDVIYHLITSISNTPGEIEKTIYSAQSIWPPTMAFLTSLNKNRIFKNTQKIKSDVLRTMAEKVEKIIVAAYDMVGYLVWHRK
jgi:hypothetical protein